MSVSSAEHQGNSYSDAPISADGRYVAFQSRASNLVDEDTIEWPDVVVRSPLP